MMKLQEKEAHSQMNTCTQNTLRQRLDVFFSRPRYIFLIMALTGFSNLFGAELAVYTLFTAIIVYVCLWGRDLLPLMPIVICCYVAPSVGNNPGKSDTSVFTAGHGGLYILILGLIIAGVLLYRVIRDRKQFFSQKRVLLLGLVLLSISYLLSGIGSQGYTNIALKNIFFALLQGACILIPYWLFTGGVQWKTTRRDYFAWMGFALGCLLFVQILWIYCTDTIVVDGIIDRSRIYTGWGIYNNMGCMLAMMIPFAFYLASKYRKGWIGTVAGSVFLIGVFLTCSRASILVGVVCYVVCVGLMLFYARNRKGNLMALIIVICSLVLTVLVFHRQLYRLFSGVFSMGMDPNSRDSIFVSGLKQFMRAPVFGISFYPPEGLAWSWATTGSFRSFFPDRWHNTVIQLLAGCGITGFAAYCYHRYQTVRLLMLAKTQEQLLIGCSVLTLLACSMFDCHLFNLGPALFYSMALAFGEKRG